MLLRQQYKHKPFGQPKAAGRGTKIRKLKTLLTIIVLILLISVIGLISSVNAENSYSSSKPPPDFVPIKTPQKYGLAEALIIQDGYPWDTHANELVLQEFGITYDIVNSENLSSWDLSEYRFIIIAADQNNQFYTNITNNIGKISDYVNQGGLLFVHAADWGWHGGRWNDSILPGGVTHIQIFIDIVSIVDPEHPVVKGTNGAFDIGSADPNYLNHWNSSTHGYFTNIPNGTKTILIANVNEDEPVYIDYNYGNGKVLATTQTIELAYNDGIHRNVLGAFAPELLRNEIRFARVYTGSGGNSCNDLLCIQFPGTISLNSDGWYSPNPIELTVKVNNNTGQTLNDQVLILNLSDNTKMVIQDGLHIFTPTNMTNNFTRYLGDIQSGGQKSEKWKIWLQPSNGRGILLKTTLKNSWDLSSGVERIRTLTIPTAQIKPVVVIPGLTGSMPDQNGNWVIDPIYHTYDTFLKELRLTGYEDNKTLFTFPYDWRKDVVESGFRLQQKVTLIKNRVNTLNLAYVNKSKVDLIGHSLGGLVARAYLQSADYPGYSGPKPQYQEDVGKLITLGTPHQGAPGAYLGAEGVEMGGGPMDYLKKIIFRRVAAKHGFCTSLMGIGDYEVCTPTDKDLYHYIKTEVPSAREILPVKSLYPTYLQSENGTEFPFGRPENPFLETLNQNVGSMIDSLGGENIISVAGGQKYDRTTSILKVVPRDTKDIPLWEHGKVPKTTQSRLQGKGDDTVLTISADITNIDNRTKKIIRGYVEGKENNDNFEIKHQWIPTQLQKTIANLLTNGQVFFDSGYSENNPSKGALMISNLSPVELLIIDKDGKKVGFDPQTQTVVNEIPSSFVSRPTEETEPDTIFLPEAVEGNYTIKAYGKAKGKYAIIVTKLTDEGTVDLNQFNGEAAIGQTYTHTFIPDLTVKPKELISLNWIKPTNSQEVNKYIFGESINFEFKITDNNNQLVIDNEVIVLITKTGGKEDTITTIKILNKQPKGKIDYISINKETRIYHLDFHSKWYKLNKDTLYNAYVFYRGEQLGNTSFIFPSKPVKK